MTPRPPGRPRDDPERERKNSEEVIRCVGRVAVGMEIIIGDSHEYGHGMGMGTVMNPVGIPRRFSNGCETKLKRVCQTRDKCRSRCLNFASL